jgi:hypothetical protein
LGHGTLSGSSQHSPSRTLLQQHSTNLLWHLLLLERELWTHALLLEQLGLQSGSPLDQTDSQAKKPPDNNSQRLDRTANTKDMPRLTRITGMSEIGLILGTADVAMT